MMGGLHDFDNSTWRVHSGASKHFNSDVSPFTSWDPDVKNITFIKATGTTITLRAVCTMKFNAYDYQRRQRIVTLNGVYFVPYQPHDLVPVGQLARDSQDQWESPDLKRCAWENHTGTKNVFNYVNEELITSQ